MAFGLRNSGQASRVITLGLAILAGQVVSDEGACHGFDEMWGLCPGLPSCEDCTPVDCQFAEWGEWYDSFGHCTGLKFRERSISVVNNECGKPCSGPKIESVEHVPQDCLLEMKHCALSDWSAWSKCMNTTGQAFRSRQALSPPENGGEPCTGSTQETMPCGRDRKPVPCLLTEWQEWTTCSVSCGVGRHTRMRRILNTARNGGEACEDATLETKACKQPACEGRDCVVGDWSGWSACDLEAHPQRFRTRQVQENAVGVGRRCNETLKETQGCPTPDEQPCLLSEWSEWAALGWREPKPPGCSKECGGGQAVRTRTMQAPPKHGGQCPESSLRELKACNTMTCSVDCKLEEWSEWSGCSVECGKGSMTRARKIANAEQLHSHGCQGALEEALPCLGKLGMCPHTDCTWSLWNDWSSCTASCGGGMTHRMRAIQALPENGGTECEALTKSEASPCNTHQCGQDCVDGKWSQWQEWESCTATCGGAYTVRRRNVELWPNACGRPVAGVRHEYKACTKEPCVADTDCQLSEWSEWSFCSGTCFGVHERNRYIKVFPRGGGKKCDMASLKETAPCSPGPGEAASGACKLAGPADCALGLWGDWSGCSKSCGGGQRERRRKVLALPSRGGRPCDADLTAVAPCSPDTCVEEKCLDCAWGEWSEWGDCSGCNGERYRHRSIHQMPNHCGRMCDLKSAKEVSKCSAHCEASLYCAWTEWSTATGCGVGCGPSMAMRSRALSLSTSAEGALFAAGHGGMCQGAQLNVSACEATTPCTPPCIPMNCEFGTWSEWSQPTEAGLCERRRDISAQNNECGEPCHGDMSETKKCPTHNLDRRDCTMSDWSKWSSCNLNGNVGQRYRERNIMQEPSFDGTPCQASLHETAQCSPIPPKHCELAEWDDWAACEKSCDGGLQSRQRKVLQHAEHGGTPCQDSLDEMRMCNEHPCVVDVQDCAYGEWTAWSGCGGVGQRYRHRGIKTYALGAGAACSGELEETEACAEAGEVDCVVSDWTAWDDCDKTCEGGQTRRQRQIMVFPSTAGKACPGALIETSGCNAVPCGAQDCQVSDWQEWSHCSATCGTAQRQRSRAVLQSRGLDGTGCNLQLSEVGRCEQPACAKDDCEWGEWEAWSACSSSCNGGQQSRNRHIAKMPTNGGEMCKVLDKAELRACNTHSCDEPACEDGLWADWTAWAGCSASCGGGTTWRTRQVARTASECGKPLEGDSRETAVCNADVSCEPDVDCVFSAWGVWSACSQTCHGIMRRSRRIERYGSGKGAFCEGHLKEVTSCNPVPGEGPGPCEVHTEPPVDCQLGDWSGWDACTVTCGGGEHSRVREIAVPAANGGQPCGGALREARQCSSAVCEGPEPVDCAFGKWEDWGACSKCEGERLRFRHVTQYARHGGKACDPFEAEEAEPCPGGRQCGGEPKYCTWGAWASWSECSAKCGQGKRMRRRYLSLSAEPALLPGSVKEMMDLYTDMRSQAQALEASRAPELLLAFACGLVSFVVVLAGSRAVLCSSTRHLARRAVVAGRSEELAATELPLVGLA